MSADKGSALDVRTGLGLVAYSLCAWLWGEQSDGLLLTLIRNAFRLLQSSANWLIGGAHGRMVMFNVSIP